MNPKSILENNAELQRMTQEAHQQKMQQHIERASQFQGQLDPKSPFRIEPMAGRVTAKKVDPMSKGGLILPDTFAYFVVTEPDSEGRFQAGDEIVVDGAIVFGRPPPVIAVMHKSLTIYFIDMVAIIGRIHTLEKPT